MPHPAVSEPIPGSDDTDTTQQNNQQPQSQQSSQTTPNITTAADDGLRLANISVNLNPAESGAKALPLDTAATDAAAEACASLLTMPSEVSNLDTMPRAKKNEDDGINTQCHNYCNVTIKLPNEGPLGMDLLSMDGGEYVKINGIATQSEAGKNGVCVGDVPVYVATSMKIPYTDFVQNARTMRPLLFGVIRNQQNSSDRQPAPANPQHTQTQQKSSNRWTAEEHRSFLQCLEKHGRNWKIIATIITSRTAKQIKSHAQKYFQKLAKARQNGEAVPVQQGGQHQVQVSAQVNNHHAPLGVDGQPVVTMNDANDEYGLWGTGEGVYFSDLGQNDCILSGFDGKLLLC